MSLSNLDMVTRAEVRKSINEIADSLTRIAGERELHKTILDDLDEKYGIDKRMIRKLARAQFKGDFDEIASSFNDFETAYLEIVKNKTT